MSFEFINKKAYSESFASNPKFDDDEDGWFVVSVVELFVALNCNFLEFIFWISLLLAGVVVYFFNSDLLSFRNSFVATFALVLTVGLRFLGVGKFGCNDFKSLQ